VSRQAFGRDPTVVDASAERPMRAHRGRTADTPEPRRSETHLRATGSYQFRTLGHRLIAESDRSPQLHPPDRTAIDSGTQPTISPRTWRDSPPNEKRTLARPQSEVWTWTTGPAVGLAFSPGRSAVAVGLSKSVRKRPSQFRATTTGREADNIGRFADITRLLRWT